MSGAKSKSLIFIGLLFNCLDVSYSLLALFSDVTLKGILTLLIPNTIYAIQAEAIDKNGIILAETQIIQSTAPAIPVIDRTYSKLRSVTVERRAVPGATGYLLAAQDGDSSMETVVTNSPGTVTGLKPATLYRIAIRSMDSGKSQPSPFRKAKPVLAAPISVTSLSCDSIAVSKAVNMAAGFSVSLMRSDGLGRMLKENTTNTSLTFTNLDPGTLSTIKTHAWNVNGIPGNDLTYNQRTTKKFAFLKPLDVQVASHSGAFRAGSWTPTEGALTSVTASSGLLKLKRNTSFASCMVPSLQCGSEYYVSVTAYDDAGSSKPTDPVSLKTRMSCAPGNTSIEEDEPSHLLVLTNFGHYYVVFVKSDDGLEVHCNTTLTQCHFQSGCGFAYFISTCAYVKAGQSPLGDVFNYTAVPLIQNISVPCSPEIKNNSKEALSVISVHWQSSDEAATYIFTGGGEAGLQHCTRSGNSCTLFNLRCGSAFSVSAIARSPAGQSLPSYSAPLETAPCCPNGLILTQVTQSVTNTSWSVGMGAQTYVMTLESPKGQAKCHTLQNYCLLCIACGTNCTVSLKAISETGLTSTCTYQGSSSSACCPSGVKLYRLGNNSIRVYWRASDETINYNTDLHGSKGNFTHTPNLGLSHCDIMEIPRGDAYTVVVSPVTAKGPKLTFCPEKVIAVTCFGSSVGMGKSTQDIHSKSMLSVKRVSIT
ncbi:LOW QUALITY PROTEIN: fibronectin type III domain-containing protein 7 [Leptosomus discolor]